MIYWKYICFILLKSEYIPEKSLFLFNFREKLTVLVRSKYHKIYIIVETQHKVGRGGGWQKGGTHEKRIRGGRIKTGNRGKHKTGYRLQKKSIGVEWDLSHSRVHWISLQYSSGPKRVVRFLLYESRGERVHCHFIKKLGTRQTFGLWYFDEGLFSDKSNE